MTTITASFDDAHCWKSYIVFALIKGIAVSYPRSQKSVLDIKRLGAYQSFKELQQAYPLRTEFLFFIIKHLVYENRS